MGQDEVHGGDSRSQHSLCPLMQYPVLWWKANGPDRRPPFTVMPLIGNFEYNKNVGYNEILELFRC